MQVSQPASNTLSYDTSRLGSTGEIDPLSPEYLIGIDHSVSETPDAAAIVVSYSLQRVQDCNPLLGSTA